MAILRFVIVDFKFVLVFSSNVYANENDVPKMYSIRDLDNQIVTALEEY